MSLLMKRKFVDELHWIKSEEILDLTAPAVCPRTYCCERVDLIDAGWLDFAGAIVCIFERYIHSFYL